MYKFISAFTTALLLTGATAFASPTVEFDKGAVVFEIGSTLNSKVIGEGRVAADVNGKSGFRYSLTTGLGNNLALQYKQGMFKSEDATIMGISTYAQAEPIDVNLLYKVNPNITLIAGYEHDKISYGKAVADASKSAMHFGVVGTHKLNDKADLFATLIAGQDVSLKEIGISYKASHNVNYNVSYAERKMNNLDLTIPSRFASKEDYTMSGISCMMAVKF